MTMADNIDTNIKRRRQERADRRDARKERRILRRQAHKK
jgi:hypothetical protein